MEYENEVSLIYLLSALLAQRGAEKVAVAQGIHETEKWFERAANEPTMISTDPAHPYWIIVTFYLKQLLHAWDEVERPGGEGSMRDFEAGGTGEGLYCLERV